MGGNAMPSQPGLSTNLPDNLIEFQSHSTVNTTMFNNINFIEVTVFITVGIVTCCLQLDLKLPHVCSLNSAHNLRYNIL